MDACPGLLRQSLHVRRRHQLWLDERRNSSGSDYQPDVTSYDYDVAVGEGGELRPKYFALRRAIQQATGVTPPDPPQSRPPAALPAVPLAHSASLWTALPLALHAVNSLSMEEVDQAYGYILYRTTLHGPVGGLLHGDQLHDYARIYLDGRLARTLDRRNGQSVLAIHSAAASAQLDILVENSGRVNYGKTLAQGRAGISQQVLLAGQPLTGWEIFPLPMQNTAALPFSTLPCTGPVPAPASIAPNSNSTVSPPTPSSTPARWARVLSG